MMKFSPFLSTAILFFVCFQSSFAQQFQVKAGAIPGPVVWSEGVIAFDANGDGLMDVLYTNGNGFASASGPLAPTLLINQGPVLGVPVFQNETSTRLPAGLTQQGKGVTVCDPDNDGDEDIIFANGFNNQPRILINDGTGVFVDETSSRFPTMNLNSFGAAFGDVDNDGDLDLVFAHAGASAFGGVGGQARLFLNDGTGHFTDGSANLNAVNKIGAQGAQMVDLNNDFALDVVVEGKSSGQQTYINDGFGNFSFSAATLPAGTASTYSFDFADLDNDNDSDGFCISLSGFNEGTAKNNLIESGSLTFTSSIATLTGLNGQDDNDIAFLDANNDGLLDVIVCSLANNKEKLYLNSGTFAGASFVYQPTGFSTITDSSLDLAVADFDNDGAYDVVTAQGESGNFLNRYYKNTGPVDTVAPRIGRVEGTPATVVVTNPGAGLNLVKRAWVQDAVVADGRSFVKADLVVTASKGSYLQMTTTPMLYSGGQIWRGLLNPAPSPEGLIGMDVSYQIHAVDPFGNASDSSPVTFRICGVENYGTLDAVNKMTISSTSNVQIAQTITVSMGNGPASKPGLLLLGFSRVNLPLEGGTLLVDLSPVVKVGIGTGPLGNAFVNLTIPDDPGLVGLIVDMQGVLIDPSQPLGFSFTIGLELCIAN